MTSSRTIPALWSLQVLRSQVRMRQNQREMELPAPCVSCRCCRLCGIRWDLMDTGIRLQTVTTLSGPALAGQWVWLMTFFQLERTGCPKRVGFICSLGIVRHDGEKKNGKYVCQGAESRLVVNHHVEKRNKRTMSRGSTAWREKHCQESQCLCFHLLDSHGPKSFTCSKPFQSP